MPASLALSSLLSVWHKQNSPNNKSIYTTMLLNFYICAKPKLTHWYPGPRKKCHYFCTGVYIPSESIRNDYHCCFLCFCWISLYWVDKNQWISQLIKNEKIYPTGKHWVNDRIVPALLVYQLVRAERDRSLNGSQLQELAIEYRWLYLFGHFHYAWYFIWYALELQYLYLKTKAHLLTYTFVCEHQVVWNSVLSEQFDEQAVM